jgi:DNA-binding response OmpR family regulator
VEGRGVEDEIKVLLIEDDEATAEMYRLRMTADGYTVLIARDGQEGIAMAEREQPDLVYLDLRLPKMDGLEVLKRLREAPTTSGVPVVILTNYGEPELRERGLELGALEFLIKADTTPAILSRSVERWTEAQIPSLEA